MNPLLLIAAGVVLVALNRSGTKTRQVKVRPRAAWASNICPYGTVRSAGGVCVRPESFQGPKSPGPASYTAKLTSSGTSMSGLALSGLSAC